MKSGVYIITCLSENKHYIGKASFVTSRLNSHKQELRDNVHANPYLQNAFNKYGEQNFLFDKIELYPKEFIASMENWWCNMLNTHNRKFGYNIKPTNPDDNYVHAEETKVKIGNSNKGKVRTSEFKKYLSQIQQDPKVKEKREITRQRTLNENPQIRKRLSELGKERMKNSDYKNNWLEKSKETYKTEKFKERKSSSLKESLNRPDHLKVRKKILIELNDSAKYKEKVAEGKKKLYSEERYFEKRLSMLRETWRKKMENPKYKRFVGVIVYHTDGRELKRYDKIEDCLSEHRISYKTIKKYSTANKPYNDFLYVLI